LPEARIDKNQNLSKLRLQVNNQFEKVKSGIRRLSQQISV
jgi:hypothetical protein